VRLVAINVGRGWIDLDVSRALTTVNALAKDMKKENFDKCLEYTIKDAGNRCVKNVIKQEVVHEYAVSSRWVGNKVQSAKYSGSGGAIACVIPIRGERGTIGGIFSAAGGAYAAGRARKDGKALKRLKNKKSNIMAHILQGETSILPGKLPNQGNNPPFRMPNGAVMTRTKHKPKPIARVVGRAVPQMVDKHFEKRIQKPIEDYIVKRFQENAKRFLKV
jgi:hypothetical protein